MSFAPYIATLLVYAVLGALVSLLGLRSMTADFNVTLTWALMTFVLITYNKIKSNGIGGYFKGFAQPIAFMLPLNLISEVATPLSMAFRMLKYFRRNGYYNAALWSVRSFIIGSAYIVFHRFCCYQSGTAFYSCGTVYLF